MKRNCWFPNTLGRDDSNKPKVGMSSAPEAKGHEPRRTSMKSQQADSLRREQNRGLFILETATAAKSLQSCPTLCDPIDGSPPGSSVSGILQARILEWVAISFSNAWKWKVKVKSVSRAQLFETPWTAAYQTPPSMEFSRQEYWSGLPLPSLDMCIPMAYSCWCLAENNKTL